MNKEIDPQDEIDVTNLLLNLKIMRENHCAGCGATICGHEALMSLVMGSKDTPRCWQCLSTALAYNREVLRDHLFALIARRSCYYAGWSWANQDEGFEKDACPNCLWPTLSTHDSSKQPILSSVVQDRTPTHDTDSKCDAEWDAGDMGCGDLVLDLRIRLQSLVPGQILKVLATDPGAKEDLPAWCRMTGNTLVASHHPAYLIKRKTIPGTDDVNICEHMKSNEISLTN